MIYTYEDIVKKTEETIRFKYIGSSDIGKIITIHLEKEDCGGRIIDITDTGIVFYKEHVTLNLKRVNKRSFVSIKTLSENPNNKIRIYEPINGEYVVYGINECIQYMPERVEFNTDILKLGRRFFIDTGEKTGVIEVTGSSPTCIYFDEISGLYGGASRSYGLDLDSLKSIENIQLTPLEDVTNFQLLSIGFNGYTLNTKIWDKLKELLKETEVCQYEND